MSTVVIQNRRTMLVHNPVAFVRSLAVAVMLGNTAVTQAQIRFAENLYSGELSRNVFIPYARFGDGTVFMKQWASASVKYFTLSKDLEAAMHGIDATQWYATIREHVAAHHSPEPRDLLEAAEVAWMHASIEGGHATYGGGSLAKLYGDAFEAHMNGTLVVDSAKIKRRLATERALPITQDFQYDHLDP